MTATMNRILTGALTMKKEARSFRQRAGGILRPLAVFVALLAIAPAARAADDSWFYGSHRFDGAGAKLSGDADFADGPELNNGLHDLVVACFPSRNELLLSLMIPMAWDGESSEVPTVVTIDGKALPKMKFIYTPALADAQYAALTIFRTANPDAFDVLLASMWTAQKQIDVSYSSLKMSFGVEGIVDAVSHATSRCS
jgi:hypothetical protein